MEARKRTAGRQITKDDAPEPEGEEEPVGTWQKADDVRIAAHGRPADSMTPAHPSPPLIELNSSLCSLTRLRLVNTRCAGNACRSQDSQSQATKPFKHCRG